MLLLFSFVAKGCDDDDPFIILILMPMNEARDCSLPSSQKSSVIVRRGIGYDRDKREKKERKLMKMRSSENDNSGRRHFIYDISRGLTNM